LRASRWITLLTGTTLMAACVVLAPLDEVNTRVTDGGAGSGGSAGDASQLPCETNAECSQLDADQPYRCVKPEGTCVALKTEQCRLVYDGKKQQSSRDHTDPNAIFLGAFANYGSTPGEGHDIFNYRFALSELSGTNVQGVPGPNATFRPIVLVVCDNADSRPDRADIVAQGLEHLVNRVRVPAILAALREEDLLRNFGTFGVGKGTFFLSPFGANRQLADAPDEDLLWHMLGLPEQLAPAYVALLKRLETRLGEQRSLTTIKVAAVSSNEGFDTELSRIVLRDLRFNGDKNVTTNQTEGNFLLQTLDAGTDLTAATNRIIEFRPHVVISLAGEAFTDPMLPNLETELGVDATYFVLSPVNAGSLNRSVKPMLRTTLAIRPNVTKRYFGINVAGAEDKSLYNDYLGRLHRDFPNAREGTENYYDAMYFLVYALHAGNPLGNVVGTNLPNGMLRLLSGSQQYSVGPDDLASVYGTLAVSGNRISLNGTLGPPAFDAATGVRISKGSVFCFASVPSTEPEVTEENDVLRLDNSGALQFSMGYTTANAPCFDNDTDL